MQSTDTVCQSILSRPRIFCRSVFFPSVSFAREEIIIFSEKGCAWLSRQGLRHCIAPMCVHELAEIEFPLIICSARGVMCMCVSVISMTSVHHSCKHFCAEGSYHPSKMNFVRNTIMIWMKIIWRSYGWYVRYAYDFCPWWWCLRGRYLACLLLNLWCQYYSTVYMEKHAKLNIKI